MSQHNPSLDTHVPVVAFIPKESNDIAVGREDIPPPSLWQKSVKVTRKKDGKEAVVNRIDWAMGMFRAYYPDETDPKTGEKGRFADRTEWEHCRDWNVAVTYSPKELERQAARALLEEEIAKLDAKSLAAVSVLCDDADPAKALAKLDALRQLGVVKVSAEAAKAAVDEVRKDSKK